MLVGKANMVISSTVCDNNDYDPTIKITLDVLRKVRDVLRQVRD